MTSLADIMVTVSMASEIARVDPDPRFGELLAQCAAALHAHYHPERRIFLEHALTEPNAPRDLPETRLFCPGDSLEAAWFVLNAHTEAIYAIVFAYSLTRESRWLEWLERIDTYAFSHFADPEHGEWFGYCDRQGNLTSTAKGHHYKGCFHVPRMLLMSAQRLEEIAAQPEKNPLQPPPQP